ncbi:MAG: glycine radical domain-containing protein [Betaproteobacteria bacterium]
MQFNVVSRETLLAAQKNPERYRNLIVRLAGYSAYFVSLDKTVQQDIIERTEERRSSSRAARSVVGGAATRSRS